MISATRVAFRLALVVALVVLPGESWATDDSTATAIRELATNQDFRVRTQAALALGATGNASVVTPLCQALDDGKAAVRAAVAAALGKLALGGAECLERRQERETVDSVKAAILRALKDVSAASDGQKTVEGVIDGSTRLYVAIGKTTDLTERKKSKVPELVRRALVTALLRQQGVSVCPDGESKAQSQKKLKGKKGVRGILLSPKLESPQYAGDSLTVRFEIAILTYPEKALKGMIPIKLTQEGAVRKSEETENELVGMAAERAVIKLIKNIERID